jgi:hypothetical protein
MWFHTVTGTVNRRAVTLPERHGSPETGDCSRLLIAPGSIFPVFQKSRRTRTRFKETDDKVNSGM